MPKKHVDPLPQTFDSLEAAAEFWDSHDTMDYPEAFSPEENVTLELRRRYCDVEIEMSVAEALQEKARQRGLSVSELATEMLRQQLQKAA